MSGELFRRLSLICFGLVVLVSMIGGLAWLTLNGGWGLHGKLMLVVLAMGLLCLSIVIFGFFWEQMLNLG